MGTLRCLLSLFLRSCQLTSPAPLFISICGTRERAGCYGQPKYRRVLSRNLRSGETLFRDSFCFLVQRSSVPLEISDVAPMLVCFVPLTRSNPAANKSGAVLVCSSIFLVSLSLASPAKLLNH